MKNKDVHEGLSQREVRDFIGETLHNNYYEDLEFLEEQMKQLQDKIKRAKIHYAMTILMNNIGWHWFDISDEIEDYNTKTYIGFVGTNEEYNEKIAKEK